jgi:hypothetical protein
MSSSRAFALPVALGGEVDDVPRIQQVRWDDKHPARPHLIRPAGPLVEPEVFGIGLLELQGDTLTHDADTVHRVHQSFGVALKQEIPMTQAAAAENCSVGASCSTRKKDAAPRGIKLSWGTDASRLDVLTAQFSDRRLVLLC